MSAYSQKRTFAACGNQFLSVGAFDPTRGGPFFQSADQLANRRRRQARFADRGGKVSGLHHAHEHGHFIFVVHGATRRMVAPYL